MAKSGSPLRSALERGRAQKAGAIQLAKPSFKEMSPYLRLLSRPPEQRGGLEPGGGAAPGLG